MGRAQYHLGKLDLSTPVLFTVNMSSCAFQHLACSLFARLMVAKAMTPAAPSAQESNLGSPDTPPLPGSLRTLRLGPYRRCHGHYCMVLSSSGRQTRLTTAEPGPVLQICAHHFSDGDALQRPYGGPQTMRCVTARAWSCLCSCELGDCCGRGTWGDSEEHLHKQHVRRLTRPHHFCLRPSSQEMQHASLTSVT